MILSIKYKLFALISSLSIAFLINITSYLQDTNLIRDNSKIKNYSNIKSYATDYLKHYKSDVNLDNPIELYDSNNKVVALFFADKNCGYIIININNKEVPELSPESNNKFIVNKNKKYFYNGPIVYMEEINNTILDLKSKFEIGSLRDLKHKLNEKKLYKFNNSNNANIASDNSQAVISKISGTLPNYSYNPNGICGSTAAAMFLSYYHTYINKKFVPSNLYSPKGIPLIKTLIPYIDGNIPGSNPGQLETGIYSYLKSLDINPTIYLDYSSIGIIAGLVANNQPFIVGLRNHPVYGNHWVTGYGFSGNYAIINDGWGSTGIYIDVSCTDYIIY